MSTYNINNVNSITLIKQKQPQRQTTTLNRKIIRKASIKPTIPNQHLTTKANLNNTITQINQRTPKPQTHSNISRQSTTTNITNHTNKYNKQQSTTSNTKQTTHTVNHTNKLTDHKHNHNQTYKCKISNTII